MSISPIFGKNYPEDLVKGLKLKPQPFGYIQLSQLLARFIRDNLDEHTRLIHWNLATGRLKRAMELADRAHLIRALDGLVPAVRTHALIALERIAEKDYGGAQCLEKGVTLGIIGSIGFDYGKIRAELQKRGIKARFCIRKDTTHVIVSEKLRRQQEAALQWAGPTLGVNQLYAFLRCPESPLDEKDLIRLLRGSQECIAKALEILESGTVSDGVRTDLFMTYQLKKIKKRENRRAALALLSRDGNDRLRGMLALRTWFIPPNRSTPRQSDAQHIRRCTDLGLDAMRMAWRMFDEFHGSINFLIRNVDAAGRRSLLRKLIQDGEIDLHKQGIYVLPDEIGDFPELTALTLDENNLTRLPKSIGKLVNLERLGLTMNYQLAELPESMNALRALKMLSWTYAPLKKCPAWLGELERLEYLAIGGTKMTELPASFSKLKNLRQLHINYTAFKKFPAVLFDLPALEILWTDADQIVKVIPQLGRFTKLKKLKLSQHNKPLDDATRKMIHEQLPGSEIIYAQH